MSPLAAAGAYARVQQGAEPGMAAFGMAAPGMGDFSSVMTQALGTTIAAGHAADRATVGALSGQANLTEVVTAVSRAERALQTATALRDRMVSAYQDVMRMAI